MTPSASIERFSSFGGVAPLEQSSECFDSPDPVRVSIAQLTNVEIQRMDENDLVLVIEMADIRPVDRALLRSLEFRNLGELRRIVLATRTACRDYWLRAQKLAQASQSPENNGLASTTTIRLQLH